MRVIAIVFITLFFSLNTYAKKHVISQKDKKFSQTSIKVKLGDSIEFTNDEKDITHNVYSITPGRIIKLESQPPGDSDIVEIAKGKFTPGKMTVECAIHPDMKLEVEITE